MALVPFWMSGFLVVARPSVVGLIFSRGRCFPASRFMGIRLHGAPVKREDGKRRRQHAIRPKNTPCFLESVDWGSFPLPVVGGFFNIRGLIHKIIVLSLQPINFSRFVSFYESTPYVHFGSGSVYKYHLSTLTGSLGFVIVVLVESRAGAVCSSVWLELIRSETTRWNLVYASSSALIVLAIRLRSALCASRLLRVPSVGKPRPC